MRRRAIRTRVAAAGPLGPLAGNIRAEVLPTRAALLNVVFRDSANRILRRAAITIVGLAVGLAVGLVVLAVSFPS